MELVVKTLFTGLTLQPSKSVKEKEALHYFIPNLSTKPQSFSCQVRCRTQGYWRRENYRRVGHVCAVVSEDVGVSSSGDVLVTRSTNQEGELKISAEVSGARTRVIFDEVFDKMVAAAQPIPGFRRAKGGKLNDSFLTANGDVDTSNQFGGQGLGCCTWWRPRREETPTTSPQTVDACGDAVLCARNGTYGSTQNEVEWRAARTERAHAAFFLLDPLRPAASSAEESADPIAASAASPTADIRLRHVHPPLHRDSFAVRHRRLRRVDWVAERDSFVSGNTRGCCGGVCSHCALSGHGGLAHCRKTPNVPRDVLLQILGPSKVYKEVIKKVINSTVAEYVEKVTNTRLSFQQSAFIYMLI
ncbi:hypothetical protein Tsubulata_027087 [Turnera subulata]|uniref:Trigger factor ribosome-binding bacterial domain-containing protein n=1 Tax=Turnera subulata TaxID=218843 RepID=A0A9Q0G5D2_9ROSI|nr:hypothetical protein Tsubulata_027087 [Turnera subulata]